MTTAAGALGVTAMGEVPKAPQAEAGGRRLGGWPQPTVPADWAATGLWQPLPGTLLRGQAHFEVEEVAQYLPEGAGDHLYLWVEKKDVSAATLLATVAAACGTRQRDVGYAGLKDTWATTRQWLSVPRGPQLIPSLQGRLTSLDPQTPWEALPACLAGAQLAPGVCVLRAAWHRNKLRCGHLRGNRFRLLLADLPDTSQPLIEARLEALRRHGMPNYFGPQRFGPMAINVARGLRLLATGGGEATGRRQERRGRGVAPWQTRLLLSAVQSALFNEVLRRRLEGGLWMRLLPGDVLQKRDSGGLFVSEGGAVDSRRHDAGDIAITGPLFGPKMTAAMGEAGLLEESVLREAGLQPACFAVSSRHTQGARRPLRIVPEDVSCAFVHGSAELCFSLPAGSFASVLADMLLQRAAVAEAPTAAARGVTDQRAAGHPEAGAEAAVAASP